MKGDIEERLRKIRIVYNQLNSVVNLESLMKKLEKIKRWK